MASTKMSPTDAQQEIARIKGLWRPRNAKIIDWYNILLQVNELQTEGLESYITNDPRTAYNMALHLLTPRKMPIKIPNDPITLEQVPQASEIERGVHGMWSRVDRFNRQRGRGSWLREFNSIILATGWYAVLGLVIHNDATKMDEALAEIWAPTDTYPEFDNDAGLVQVVHSYTVTLAAFTKKAKALGWTIPSGLGSTFVLDDWWFLDDDSGDVVNSTWIGQNPAKKYEPDAHLTRIPVSISPAGGLPDKGSILTNQTWREHLGEALVATNESVNRNYNRQMTFLQQLLRDTAQPSSYEKNQGTKIVADPESLHRRGAHFRMGINEDMGFLSKPPIPVEVRSQLFDIHAQAQRGSLPDMMFGNMAGDINSLMISQVSSSAQQMLSSYQDATEFASADISNLWLEQIEAGGFQPWGIKIPKRPLGVEFIGDLHISIPGDLTNRATIARMLNPQFELSTGLVLDILFANEISDPERETARVDAERALRNPIADQIRLIAAFTEHAKVLQQAGDRDQAQRFLTAAQKLDQQLQNPQDLAAQAQGAPTNAGGGGLTARPQNGVAQPSLNGLGG